MTRPLPDVYGNRLTRGPGNRLERGMRQAEVSSALERQRDRLAIARVEQATVHGIVAVAQLSCLEASLAQAAPHAAPRLRAIADAGTIGIAGVVARSGF